ncbi:hypothetical protein RhiJN_06876 [Ceratobasidium sp. AG-Ba]|nr:hypothetical protein RhiJN_06876 [Ceratobasidium sp. AG-Ba]
MATTASRNVIKNLPPEILLAVCYHCSHAELCALVLINHDFYTMLIPEIYTHVKLYSRRTIESFSDALVNGKSNLKTFPRSIYIYPKQLATKLLFRLANSVRQALSQTTNLRDLTLLLQYKAVKSIFRDITYPFHLTRLACPAISGRDFSRFLQKQNSLEELVVLRSVRGGITVGTVIRNLIPDSLPRLDSISASHETLAALIPGRPIRCVSTGAAALHPNDYELFARSLSQSTARVGAVDVSLSYLWINTALSSPEGLVAALSNYSVSPKRFTVNLILPEPLCTQNPVLWQQHMPEALNHLYKSILDALGGLTLSTFQSLEALEIIQRQGLTIWIKRPVLPTLERILFEKLKNSCSTLRSLTLFDLTLE